MTLPVPQAARPGLAETRWPSGLVSTDGGEMRSLRRVVSQRDRRPSNQAAPTTLDLRKVTR